MPPARPPWCRAPTAGRREVPAPREVPVNWDPEGKGETRSRAGAPSPRRPDGVHETPWKHNATSGTFAVQTLHLTPPRRSLRGCPKPPRHGEPGALPQHPQRRALLVPPPFPQPRRNGQSRTGAAAMAPGPGWTAPLRAPAAPEHTRAPKPVREPRAGRGGEDGHRCTTGPGLRGEGAGSRGAGEGAPPGSGGSHLR